MKSPVEGRPPVLIGVYPIGCPRRPSEETYYRGSGVGPLEGYLGRRYFN